MIKLDKPTLLANGRSTVVSLLAAYANGDQVLLKAKYGDPKRGRITGVRDECGVRPGERQKNFLVSLDYGEEVYFRAK